ncbi:MAG TPA: amino acid ABC transporter permease, partial [Bauldia sp.]|nr:amino acid ABC transporter permease [Bauldia sp.]
MIRSLSANDLIFILFAVRWTFALVVVSLIGGSIIGLIVALLRVGDSRVIRTLAVVYIRVI